MTDQTLKDIDRAFKALEERDELLNKIKVEVEWLRLHKAQFITSDNKVCIDSQEVLNMIDKYKAESDEQEREPCGDMAIKALETLEKIEVFCRISPSMIYPDEVLDIIDGEDVKREEVNE